MDVAAVRWEQAPRPRPQPARVAALSVPRDQVSFELESALRALNEEMRQRFILPGLEKSTTAQEFHAFWNARWEQWVPLFVSFCTTLEAALSSNVAAYEAVKQADLKVSEATYDYLRRELDEAAAEQFMLCQSTLRTANRLACEVQHDGETRANLWFLCSLYFAGVVSLIELQRGAPRFPGAIGEALQMTYHGSMHAYVLARTPSLDEPSGDREVAEWTDDDARLVGEHAGDESKLVDEL